MLKKYKHLTNIYGLKYIPIRVLKFKRSKWTKLKLLLAKKLTIAARLKERRLSSRTQIKFVRFPLGFRKVSSLANSHRNFKLKKKNLLSLLKKASLNCKINLKSSLKKEDFLI